MLPAHAVAMAVRDGSPTRVAPPIGHAIPDMPIIVEPAAAPELSAGATRGLPEGRKPSLIARTLRSLLRR